MNIDHIRILIDRLLRDEQMDELILTTLVFKGILSVCMKNGTPDPSLLYSILSEALKNETNILFATRILKLLSAVCGQPGVCIVSFKIF